MFKWKLKKHRWRRGRKYKYAACCTFIFCVMPPVYSYIVGKWLKLNNPIPCPYHVLIRKIREKRKVKYNSKQIATAKHGLLILSRRDCELIDQDFLHPTILIRITSEMSADGEPVFPPLRNPAAFSVIEEYFFDDVEKRRDNNFGATYLAGYRPINAEEGKSIATLLADNFDSHLIVHCDAGICRSSAVGRAWAVIHGDKELEALVHKHYLPNVTVFSTIMKAYYERKESKIDVPQEKWWIKSIHSTVPKKRMI